MPVETLRQGRRVAIKVYEDKSLPDFGAKRFQEKVIAAKILRLVHLRTRLELAVEFERPGVIRTEKKPRVTAI